MTGPPARLPFAAALAVPLTLAFIMTVQAQSMLGQSRPGGPQGPTPVPSTAPLAPVQVLPLPGVTTPGAAQQVQPMPPPLQPAPTTPPSPAAPSTPAQPGAAAPPAVAAQPAVPIPGEWIAQGTAELRGIDKVTARTTPLTVKLGETVRFGPLSITVRGCAIRAADRPQDATAFLEVAEAGQPPLFRGWMILSQPQLALVEHPTHDIRLYACRP